MKKQLVVALLVSLFSALYVQAHAIEETKQTRQSTQGDQSPAIFISPGGYSNVTYKISQRSIDEMTQKAANNIREEFSNCLKVAAEFQTATLNELNVKLSKYLTKHTQVSNVDAEVWAQNLLQSSAEINKVRKEFEDNVKKYNEKISKMLVTSCYNYISSVLLMVDAKINALHKIDPKLTVEKDNNLVLFSDEKKYVDAYTLRRFKLPGKNFIQIVCIPGEINRGLVKKCPIIRFSELKFNTLVQQFSFTPVHPTGSLIFGTKLPYKDIRIKYKDVMYPLTGQPSLDKKTKNEFEKTFEKFFQLAYGNR